MKKNLKQNNVGIQNGSKDYRLLFRSHNINQQQEDSKMHSRKMIAVVAGVLMFAGLISECMAESEPINPSKVSTPQIVVYGTTRGSSFTGPVTISGAMTNTGAVVYSSTLGVTGLTTLNNLNVNTNTVLDGTLVVTGAVTAATNVTLNGVTTMIGPNFTGSLGAHSTGGCVITNGPASVTVTADWIPIRHGGTNYWLPAFKQ